MTNNGIDFSAKLSLVGLLLVILFLSRHIILDLFTHAVPTVPSINFFSLPP